jgi:zinc protease
MKAPRRIAGNPREAVARQGGPGERVGPSDFLTESGSVVLLEESRLLPLVHLQVTLRTGSAHDPEGLEGLSRITAKLVRMGTRAQSAEEVDRRIEELGAHLVVRCAPSYVHFAGLVLERNLEPFAALLARILTRPALRAADLRFVKRETVAEIAEICDNDNALAARHFRRFALAGHPYGRPVIGEKSSIDSIRLEDVRQHYARHYVARNRIVSAAGAVTADKLLKIVDGHLDKVAAGTRPDLRMPPPRFKRGRRVLVVDKPERTQTQILIGTLGARARDPDLIPLLVGNTVFGGTFTARLMKEIRSRRGWSYGTGSRFSKDRQRDLWSMWSFPAARDAAACIKLQMSMLEKLVDRGISERELRFARRYLIKSYAFDIDTPAKRVGQRLDVELYGLRPDFYSGFVDRIREVTRDQVNASLRARLSKRDLAVVLVATAAELRDQLASLPGIVSVKTIPYDQI